MKNTNIYTNAVDLGKMVIKCAQNRWEYEISIVKGVGGEQVVKFDYEIPEEDD